MYASVNQTITGPDRRQVIIWTNAVMLLIWSLGTNFSDILIEIHTFLFKKFYLTILYWKWWPFCLGLSVLKLEFWWPQMMRDAQRCIGNCSVCQAARKLRNPYRLALKSPKCPNTPGESWVINHVGPWDDGSKKPGPHRPKYVLVCVDAYSGYVEHPGCQLPNQTLKQSQVPSERLSTVKEGNVTNMYRPCNWCQVQRLVRRHNSLHSWSNMALCQGSQPHWPP